MGVNERQERIISVIVEATFCAYVWKIAIIQRNRKYAQLFTARFAIFSAGFHGETIRCATDPPRAWFIDVL